jgi:hypothetical protein
LNGGPAFAGSPHLYPIARAQLTKITTECGDSNMTADSNGSLPTLPKKLYKFRAADTVQDCRFLRSILLKHELYSPSPAKFNDPFDCRVPPSGDIDPNFARYLIYRGSPSTASGELSQTEHEQLQKVFQETQNRIDAGGVLALGASRGSTLMWSHYARDHCGVALEFDTSRWLEEMPYMDGQFHRVSYSKTRTKLELTRLHFDQAQFFNATILIKDVCWKSEKEWRIITQAPGPLRFPASALTGLILGCRASDMTKTKLLKLGRRLPSVTFYQAMMRTEEFGLKFEVC